jgi:hypothetical protein
LTREQDEATAAREPPWEFVDLPPNVGRTPLAGKSASQVLWSEFLAQVDGAAGEHEDAVAAFARESSSLVYPTPS